MNAPTYRSEKAFTLIEVMVAMGLSSILFIATLSTFTQLTRLANDQELRTVAQLEAQSVIDMMVPELRMIGNGVPFHQTNFLIAQSTLTDNTVTQPILVDSTTSTEIKFRLNQTGDTYIVTTDFDPSVATSVALTDVSKIYVGDEVYITNSTVGEDDGFWGKVSAIDTAGSTITFAAGTQYSPSATFLKGSLLEVVPKITYASASDYGGISRDDGTGPLTLSPRGQFTLTFLDDSNAVMTLPLVASSADPFPDSAIQNVRAIKVTVQVKSNSKLSSGDYYVATAEQSVGIRNLNYKY